MEELFSEEQKLLNELRNTIDERIQADIKMSIARINKQMEILETLSLSFFVYLENKRETL